MLLLKEEDDEIHYKRLKKLLEKHSRKFQLEELREMYTHALNFCIKKANTGQREYLYKLLDVYKSALPKGILDEGKFLSPWNYKNIVTAGLRVGETDWVKHFIEEYKVRLEKKYRDNAYTYNTARYHFHIKEYDEVIGLLQKVEYEDIYYNLSSKSMLLKIFYETDESDQLYSLLDSFEIYLRRNKLISSYHKTNYLNLVKYTRKLLRLPPKDKAKADKLRKELEAASNVSDRKWLISCIM
ncbi:MAG: hypothetical protein IH946_03865 [Bacteroidetes bacterium]|nr:hypothetical protein [Bacteroidota bacterium]